MTTGINELRTITKHLSVNANVNLMEQNVSQINGQITKMSAWV